MQLVTLSPQAAGRQTLLEASRVKSDAIPIRSPFWGPFSEPYSGAWQQHVQIDPIGQLTSFGAVYACISRIAQDIAKLEPELLVDGPDDFEIDAPAASPFWKTLERPNGYQNRIQFFAHWLTCKLLFGNAYVLKQRENVRGMVQALHILDPRRVTPMVTPEGDVYYSLGGSDLAKIPSGGMVPSSEMIHDRGITLWHALVGVSPLYAGALSATQGLKIQRNSATFFENMSRPSGMLTAAGTIDDVTAARLKREWEANYSGSNIGRLAVGGDGLKYEAMTIPAETAQLIEQLEWTVADVARCFGVPLYKINAGPMPTNNNVEALELQYYTGCLQILIESIELCLTEGLEVLPGYSVEMCLDGLARMDSQGEVEMLSKAVAGTIMKPNEARARRRLAPVAGGDTIYLQQQNFSLSALEKRDKLPNPFIVDRPVANPTPSVAGPAVTADPAAPASQTAPTKEFADAMAANTAALEKIGELPDAIARALNPAEAIDFEKAMDAISDCFSKAEVVSCGA